MDSKERVLCAIELKEPDRVPLDFSANKGTLKRLYNHFQSRDYRVLLEALNIDIVDIRGVVDPVYQGPVPKEEELEDGVVRNYWGMKSKTMQTATGPEECWVDFVLKDAETVEEMEQHRWPEVDWFNFSDMAERLRDWDDFAIMASGASVFQHPTFLRGFDRTLIDMIERPHIAEYLFDKFTDFYLEYFDRLISAADEQIDILRIADDFGMQDRPLVSPEMFEKMLVPRFKKIIDLAHSHQVKVMLHSCGNITPFIERIIEIGVDLLDPIQARAEGMDPQKIKEKYGNRICLHGTIDTQYLLPQGSAEDVENEVKKMIAICGKGGGFILAPCHVLQTDVPVENIEAMYSTGYRFG